MNLPQRLEGPGATTCWAPTSSAATSGAGSCTAPRSHWPLGVGSTLISLAIGVVLGALAAYYGKWLDEVVMRTMDILLAFPYIVLALAMAAVLGPSFENLLIIIGVLRVPQFARITRAR